MLSFPIFALRDSRRPLAWLAAVILLPLTVGCQDVAKTHQENVDAANKRWLDMRSGLMLQMAQRQFDSGDLDQAEKSLGLAMSQDAKNPQIYLLGARIAMERGQLEQANHLLALTLTLDANLPPVYYCQGIIQQRWQNHAQALAGYQKALELKPTESAYLLATAEMMIAVDQADQALALLHERAGKFDQNASIHCLMGQIHSLKKEYCKAAEEYYRAALMRPQDLFIQEQLARMQLAAGQPQAAIHQLERLMALQEPKDRPATQKLLLDAYLADGRWPQARQLAVQLTQQQPGEAAHWIRLGEICWQMQDITGCATASGRAITLAPNRADGYLLLALVHRHRGQTAQMVQSLDRAAELVPTQAEPLLMKGLEYQKQGRLDLAAKAYAQALKREPNNEQARLLSDHLSSRPE